MKSDWTVVPLGKLSKKVDYGLTASATEVGSGPKFLRITDIQDDKVDWNTVPLCECSSEEKDKFALASGDIVFARTGATTGKSFLIRKCPEGAVFASYLIRVRPSDKIDSGYLAKFFQTQSYWNQITLSSTGTAQAGVNATKLKELKIPLPPLEEQRRIAAILDKADELRRKRQEAIRLTEELLRSLFLDMFGDPVTNPKGWEIKPLSEVVHPETIVTYGIVQAGPELSEGIPYIRTGDIKDGKIIESNLLKTSPDIAEKYKRSEVHTGDLVISIRATVGTVAEVTPSLDGANLTQGTAKIAPGPEVKGNYLLWFIRSNGCQTWLQRQVKGATFREITLKRLREMPVMLPPIKLQSRFDQFVQTMNATNTKFQANEVEVDNLFSSLLQRAFRGEL